MTGIPRPRLVALCTAGILAPLCGFAGTQARTADAPTPIESVWKVQEIRFSYVAFTTAYSCDSAAAKIRAILLRLGAHPDTKVRATGCDFNRPKMNFLVTITTATPVAAKDFSLSRADASRQELLKRLGVKSDFSDGKFPAAWRKIDVSRDRKLNLEPGDCELMDSLVDHVLPMLTVKVESSKFQCTPKRLSIQTPELIVSALVPLASPDKPQGAN